MNTFLIAALLAGLAAEQEGSQAPGTAEPPFSAASKIELHRTADAALMGRRYPEAERAFSAALEADPGNATLMYGLACALAGARRSPEALECLAKARELGYRDAAVAHWDLTLSVEYFNPRFEVLFGKSPVDTTSTAGWEFTGWEFAGVHWLAALAEPSTDWIAVAPPEGGVALLEQASGKTRFDILPTPAPVVALAGSPDGLALACLHADGRLSLTDTVSAKSKLSKPAQGDTDPWVRTRVFFASRGNRIIGRTGRSISIWDAEGRYLGAMDGTAESKWSLGQPSTVSDLFPEVAGKTVRLHDLMQAGRAPEDAASAEEAPAEIKFEHPVNMALISPDGATLAVGTEPGTVHLIKLADRSVVMRHVIKDSLTGTGYDPFGDPLRVPVLQFSPDGKLLAACTTSGFKLAVFDVAAGALRWRTGHMGGRMGSPFPLLFGDELTIGDRGRRVWKSADGKKLDALPEDRGSAVAVLGSKVLLQNEEGLELIDAGSAETLWKSPQSARIRRRLEHPSGWIAGHIQNPTEDDVRRFDPKRLRAGMAGVKLLPPPEPKR